MKYLIFLLLIVGTPAEVELTTVRELYVKSSKSEAHVDELLSTLTPVTGKSDNLLVAYKGASMALSSKFVKKLSDKMTMFKEGVKWIEQAVKNDSSSVEIRFVRFTVQENVPDIVHYKMNLKADKQYILTHYNQQTTSLKNYLKAYLKTSKSLTLDEKKGLE